LKSFFGVFNTPTKWSQFLYLIPKDLSTPLVPQTDKKTSPQRLKVVSAQSVPGFINSSFPVVAK
jgi:hypothetical protein